MSENLPAKLDDLVSEIHRVMADLKNHIDRINSKPVRVAGKVFYHATAKFIGLLVSHARKKGAK